MSEQKFLRYDDLTKSPNDERLYRVITLENGLQATLVSDPETDKSAAAVSVGTGSLADPKHAQGLAHFLEHMLFMGSKKYPDENEYSKFISEHGGMDNAYTMDEETRYYFNVAPEVFKKALDIFANFFVDPLFKESSVDREMKAVDSEHMKNLNSDLWRTLQIFYENATEGSPVRQFGTGSLKTLNIPTIKEDLHKFYDEHYSANLMRLAMVGKESLDELEEMAKESFAGVKNHGYERKSFTDPWPYDESSSMKLYKIVPVQDTKELKIVWTLEDFDIYYKTKPLRYVCSLVGHEGPNSLLSFLMEQQWVTALTSYEDHFIRGCSQLMITIDLTQKGLENYEAVAQAVFAYINVIKEAGPCERYWNEYKTKLDLSFQFKGKEKPHDYTTSLTGRMQKLPTEDLLTGTALLTEYDEELISRALKSLTYEHSNVLIVSKTMEEFVDKTEQWYDSKYSINPYPESLGIKLKDPFSGLPESKTKLGLPPVNDFLPKNVDLLPLKDLPKLPTKLMETDKSLVFFKQNDTFAEPRASIRIKFYCNDNDVARNSENYVAAKIWLSLFEETMREIVYMGEQAGLQTHFDFSIEGPELNIFGFSDSMKNWVPEVIKRIYNFTITDDLMDSFQNCFEAQKKKIENYPLIKPYSQTLDGLKLNILSPSIDNFDLINHINNVTIDTLREFGENWLKKAHHEWLVVANFTADDVKEIVQKSEEAMTSTPLSRDDLLQFRVVKLPKGVSSSSKELSNPQEANSAILLYFQHSDTDLRSTLNIEVLAQYLSEPFFNQLRTIEQLGYLVYTFKQEIRGYCGLSCLIQSSVGNPQYLAERIHIFFDDIWKKVENLSDQEFKKIVNAVITMKRQKPLKLSEEAKDYWIEITNKQYIFDRKKKEVEILESLTKTEFIALYKSLLLDEAHVISLERICKSHVDGECKKPSKDMKGDIVIANHKQFITTRALYPDLYNCDPNRYNTHSDA